jgi:hypothetical protein
MVDDLAHFLHFFIWLNYILVLTPRDLEGTYESV